MTHSLLCATYYVIGLVVFFVGIFGFIAMLSAMDVIGAPRPPYTELLVLKIFTFASPVAYVSITPNHSKTPMNAYTVIGFIDDDRSVYDAEGTPLSPGRITYSRFFITMSYLKLNLYLLVLGIAVFGFDCLLFKRMGHLPVFYDYLSCLLYCVGIILYTSRVFNYRTNILVTVSMLLLLLDEAIRPIVVLKNLFYFELAVLHISYYFLQSGGGTVIVSAAAESPTAFTTVTGTGSDLDARKTLA